MIQMFQTTTIPALEQTLAFTEKRHELLAGNIANLDTPDYRARDLSVSKFQSALAEEIERAASPSPSYSSPGQYSPGQSLAGQYSPGGLSPGALSTSSGTRRVSGQEANLLGHAATRDDVARGPRAAMEPIVFHDGSDVSLERQITEIAKNQNMHNVAVATMRNQFAMLRAAISEHV